MNKKADVDPKLDTAKPKVGAKPADLPEEVDPAPVPEPTSMGEGEAKENEAPPEDAVPELEANPDDTIVESEEGLLPEPAKAASLPMHWRVLVVALLAGLAAILFASLFREPPLFVVKAEAESLQYRVTRKTLAPITIKRPVQTDSDSPCFNVVKSSASLQIIPAANTFVDYLQIGRKLSIILTAGRSDGSPATGDTNVSAGEVVGSQSCKLPAQSNFLVALPDDGDDADLALPIAGPIEIGIERARQKPPTSITANLGFLYGAVIRVYGRTSFPGSGAYIYEAEGSTFHVPNGGRLTTSTQEASGAAYGYALPGKRALEISVSVETDTLRLVRSGASRDFERPAVSLTSQIINDPSFAFIALILFLISFAYQIVASWITIRRHS